MFNPTTLQTFLPSSIPSSAIFIGLVLCLSLFNDPTEPFERGGPSHNQRPPTGAISSFSTVFIHTRSSTRAAQSLREVETPTLMTSSPRATTDCGNGRPSALAFVRLMTSSSCSDCYPRLIVLRTSAAGTAGCSLLPAYAANEIHSRSPSQTTALRS